MMFSGNKFDQIFGFITNAKNLSLQLLKCIKDTPENLHAEFHKIKMQRWQIWYKRMAALYSARRLSMIQSILELNNKILVL